MSGKNIALITMMAVLVALSIWLAIEIKAKNKYLDELEKAKQDRLKILQEYLIQTSSIPDEIKDQILKLAQEYKDLDHDVFVELTEVIKLIEIEQHEEGIRKLATIIENLLAEKFDKEGDTWYQKQKSKSKHGFVELGRLLNRAKNIGFIMEHECDFAFLVKDVRDENVHKMNKKKPDNWLIIAFLTGIEIVFKLKGVKA